MFEFLFDAGNYEERAVDRSEFDWGFISTARVSDGKQPYETAICSDEYGKSYDPKETGGMIIAEAYDTKEAAEKGHTRWVKTMTNKPPKELIDCCNAGVAGVLEAMDDVPKEIRL